MSEAFWSTAAGVLLGGAITLVVSWVSYVKAARELRTETERLRRQNDAIFGAVLNPNAKKTATYQDGVLSGVIVEGAGVASGTGSAKGASE